MTDNTFHGHSFKPVLVQEDLTFDAALPGGSVANSSGVNPNGNAPGATLTITLTGDYGDATTSIADGATLTVTVTFVPGAAYEEVFAPGDTVDMATVSLSKVGTVHTGAIDGSRIYEFTAREIQSEVYLVSDFDSIYSNGNRIANGLLQGGDYGWGVVFSPGEQGYDDSYGGNGPAAGAPTQDAPGFWFSTIGGETIDIRGFRLIGTDSIESYENFWSFHGGNGPEDYSSTPYFNFLQAFNPHQGPGDEGADGEIWASGTYTNTFYLTDYIDEPRYYSPWSHYEFVYRNGPRPDVRWTNEIWLRVAHSNLDGGDRRPSTAAPSKAVAFTMSASWTWRTGSGFTDPQDGLFDGMHKFLADKENNRKVHLGINANGADPQTTPGEWFQFVFPRPVIFKHLQFLNWNNDKEDFDSGGNPTIFGKWHWEYSLNSGGSWTAVGGTWWFRDNCTDMIAPQTPGTDFNLGAIGPDGNGATHWRMVLDEGPAFGNAHNTYQIRFNLEDVTGQAPPYTIAFTDDADGLLPVPTIGPPGSPYIVKFTDGSDDGLTTLTFTNVPNPVLTVAFTDEGQFETWSDLYPSVVVQTVVVATGR